ncbi:hypothetical protein AQPE_3441 [Aquipluma nitroreducens]|uniref:SbsA Ig-like domain-containing protein n=2 Tax=Aquipluma nitroreducens TaxID=2010828 RepID=A0A5K7SCQ8_9BACT|nr:hypothetical protein AQPE_3441 [Aquipluma nitroreducens]
MVYGGVIDRVPADGKTNVKPSTDLTLTFDYPLAQGEDYTGAVIQLFKNGDTSPADAITLPSSRFVIDGSKITIDLQATLSDNTGYYVVMPDKVVKEMKPDGTSVVFPGFVAPTATAPALDWNFTTGDFTAPKLATLSTFTPADGATNVGGAFSSSNALSIKTSSFTVKFNEPVTGVSGKYIKIYTAAGNVHEMIDAGDASRITITSSGSTNGTVEFTTTNLRENSDYYILIDAGAFVDTNADSDLNNKNPFAGLSDKTKWNFTTRDYTPAKFATDYPAFGTVASTSVDLKVKLDEPADVYFIAYSKATVDGTSFTAPTAATVIAGGGSAKMVAATTAGTEYTYKYQNLTEGEEYVFFYVSVNKAKYGPTPTNDPLTSAVGKTDSKTTLDVQAPTVAISGLTPADNATGVAQYLDGVTADGHGTVSIKFTENVKAGAGNIILKKSSDNSTVESIDITSDKVVFGPSTGTGTATDLVTVKFATKLASASGYYINIASGVISDKSGNKFDGITTATGWNFTTKDVVAPTVTFSSPAHEGVLASNETVVLTFSEDIYSDETGTVMMNSTTALSSIAVEKDNDPVTPTSVSYGAKKITITVAWTQNSTYVVKLLKNKAYDLSGNVIATEQKKSYNTDSYDDPYVGTNNTANTAVDGQSYTKNPSDNLVVRFSEDVELLGGGAITNDNIGS